MHCYARAVETGSFSAVARELGTSQPNISRSIAALEAHLGTRLMHRSTRKLTLTPEGERFYAEARRILDAVAAAESTARGEDQPSGLLRVACPTSLGTNILLPWIGQFLDLYPAVDMDLHISDGFVDLVEGGVDLAVRIGVLADSSLRARRIGASERICVASKTYLARHSAPRTPADLRDHSCIILTSLTPDTWRFSNGDLPVKGRFKVNTTDGAYRAVLDGLGVGYGPLWLFENAIRAGEVKILLPGYAGPPTPINLVYSATRLLPQRASTFMDFLAKKFSETPALGEGALSRLVKLA
jgi:LysR family transcriptional regulator, regulator for bpeEF and oprC